MLHSYTNYITEMEDTNTLMKNFNKDLRVELFDSDLFIQTFDVGVVPYLRVFRKCGKGKMDCKGYISTDGTISELKCRNGSLERTIL